jgi:hypothetical protein
MSFPGSPSNGQIATVNNITYVYSSASNTWTKSATGQVTIGNTNTSTSITTGALIVAGGAGIAGNVFAGSIYTDNLKFANGNPYTSTTIANTTDITANASSGTNVGLSLTTTGVTANTYGSSTSVPVITVDAKGRITGVTTSSISGSLTFTGDVTGTGSTGSSTALTLANSGVTAGNYGNAASIPTIVVDSKGRITSITSNAVSTTISLAGTSGSGTVSGGGTLTFASTNGVTIAVGSSYANISTPQDIRTSASPTFAGGSFTGNVTRNSKAIITNYSGNVAPASPIQGDEWFRGNTGTIYKYIYDNVSSTYNWVNYSSALYNANTAAVANTLALRDSGGNLIATNFLGTASSAKYADLAEIYTTDKNYEPGTVVVFGGTEEITATKITHDTRVAGVISTNPAYLMNSEATGLPVAFTGRVPCKVRGPVTKGDVLVTSAYPEYAERMTEVLYRPGCILGKSLGDVAENVFATVEVVVGRF